MLGNIVSETVKGCVKVYVKDALVTYSACYITGFSAVVGYAGLKAGAQFGKIAVSAAGKGVSKIFRKKNTKPEAAAEENKPEEPQE